MKNRVLIPSLILGALAVFFSFKLDKSAFGQSTEKSELILSTVKRALTEGHFNAKPFDDSFSLLVYNRLIETMDFDKRFFLQSDIDQLEQYKYKVDDDIINNQFTFYEAFSTLFNQRVIDAEAYYKEILETPFDFKEKGQIQLNGKLLKYATTPEALKERWYQYLKYRTLSKFEDLKSAQEKALDTNKNAEVKSDVALEEEARKSLKKNMDVYFKRMKKTKGKDQFNFYINAITSAQDPHTNFFPPKDKARFDEGMAGKFSGIGAQLAEEDGQIKVMMIITGSPCWKQGELKVGDIILKVGQGSKEPDDIQGFDLEDVVSKIRGPKGSEVRLTVKKLDNSQKVISIIRGDVSLEETFAKSVILEADEKRIGYINLPEFYANFYEANGRRSSVDMRLEIEKVKQAKVDGIIVDLRGNGGGSLSDVVDIAGQFIDYGPVVQVKSNYGMPQVLNDEKPGYVYDGPLVVMVDFSSASASEILAGALQDYKRAVIVGSTTFGKGTVQSIHALDELVDPYTRLKYAKANAESGNVEDTELGAIKLTKQKFYRVSGASNQLKGVVPDIILPNIYDLIDLGERKEKSALPWDEIKPANYTTFKSKMDIAALRKKSQERVGKNASFQLVKQGAERMKALEEDNSYPLDYISYKAKIEETSKLSKELEKLEDVNTGIKIENLKVDLEKINLDSTSKAKNEDWLKLLKKDIYLNETMHIMSDLIQQQSGRSKK